MRAIGSSFQLAITAPQLDLTGYGTATAQSCPRSPLPHACLHHTPCSFSSHSAKMSLLLTNAFLPRIDNNFTPTSPHLLASYCSLFCTLPLLHFTSSSYSPPLIISSISPSLSYWLLHYSLLSPRPHPPPHPTLHHQHHHRFLLFLLQLPQQLQQQLILLLLLLLLPQIHCISSFSREPNSNHITNHLTSKSSFSSPRLEVRQYTLQCWTLVHCSVLLFKIIHTG